MDPRDLYPDVHHDIDDPRADDHKDREPRADVAPFTPEPLVCPRCNNTGKYEHCDTWTCGDMPHCAHTVYEYICGCPAGADARRDRNAALAHAPSASPVETESPNGRAALLAWRSR